MDKHSLLIPQRLKAKRLEALLRLCMQNNAKRRRWHEYQFVYQSREDYWVAIYYVDLSGSLNTEAEEVQGTEQGG